MICSEFPVVKRRNGHLKQLFLTLAFRQNHQIVKSILHTLQILIHYFWTGPRKLYFIKNKKSSLMYGGIRKILIQKTENNTKRKNILFLNHLYPDLSKFLHKFYLPKAESSKEQLKPEMRAFGCHKRQENASKTNLCLCHCSQLFTPLLLRDDNSSLLCYHQALPGTSLGL